MIWLQLDVVQRPCSSFHRSSATGSPAGNRTAHELTHSVPISVHTSVLEASSPLNTWSTSKVWVVPFATI